MSDGRSLTGASLAAETSLFCHCTDVYFWARQRFRSGLLYTLPLARFLESLDPAGLTIGIAAMVNLSRIRLPFDFRHWSCLRHKSPLMRRVFIAFLVIALAASAQQIGQN